MQLRGLKCDLNDAIQGWKFLRKSIQGAATYAKYADGCNALEIAWPSILYVEQGCLISLGVESSIMPFSEIHISGPNASTCIPGQLKIGNRSCIGMQANIRAAGGSIEIGDNTIIAQGVSLIASNHMMAPGLAYRDQPWDQQKTGVFIGNGVWIGAGVIILPGVKIADGVVIAAGSVVNRSVPPSELWGGVPARLLKILN